jgi:hypothetical protein
LAGCWDTPNRSLHKAVNAIVYENSQESERPNEFSQKVLEALFCVLHKNIHPLCLLEVNDPHIAIAMARRYASAKSLSVIVNATIILLMLPAIMIPTVDC